MRKPICHNWGAQISLRCLICLRAAVVGITSANTSIAKPFPWYWSYNRTLDVLVLWGRRNKKKNMHNFDETWMNVCHCVKKNFVRKTANINTRKPWKFSHC